MKRYYLLMILICLVSVLTVKTQTVEKFQTTKYFSKNREYFVQVMPDKKAALYKGKNKMWSKLLPELPGTLVVSNDGKRVIMIENHFGNNNDRKKEVLIFFDENGEKILSYELEKLADFDNVLHTNKGAQWLDNYELNRENSELTLNTVVLSCPLIEKVSKEVDLKKVDKCKKPKPKEKIIFSMTEGKLISRRNIEPTQK